MSEKSEKREVKREPGNPPESSFTKEDSGKRSKTGLLPCPFCGSVRLSGISVPEMGKDASSDPDAQHACCFIQCEDCGANGPLRKTQKEARALWQVRADQV